VSTGALRRFDDHAVVSPHSLDAEQATLGAILVSPDCYARAAELVMPHDFFRDAHQRIFGAMRTLATDGRAIDPLTLKDQLLRTGDLDRVGGPAYIFSLTDGVPKSANLEHYARIVVERARARHAITALDRAKVAVQAGDLDAARAIVADFSTTSVSPDIYASDRGLIDDVEILSMPDMPMIIEGVLGTRSTGAIVGPIGCGKTTVAIGLGLSVAARDEFLGHRVVRNGAVVYAAREGQSMLRRRVEAAKVAYGLPLDTPAGFCCYIDDLDLLNQTSVQRFIDHAKQAAPVLGIVDTFHAAFTGDENSSRDVGLALRQAHRIRDALDCTIVFLHHLNASASRERGSTAFRASLDTMLMLTPADDALRLVCEKQRDGAAVPEIALRLTPVPGYQGQVVRLAADVLPATELTPTQARVLARLAEDFLDGASTSEWKATVAHADGAAFIDLPVGS
jgi:hypothetical protein